MAKRALTSQSPPRTIPEWVVSPWFYLLLAIAAGVVIAQLLTGQLAPRWIKALIGLVFLFGLFRLPLYAVVSLFLIAFPFPTWIFVGNTNIVLIVMMLAFWGVKVRLGKEPAPPKTYLDYAAWTYLLVHLLSFLNVGNASDLRNGIYQVSFLGSAVGLYWLVSKTIRDEHELEVALKAFVFTSLLVSITGVMDYFYPAVQLIPDSFIAAGPTGKRFAEGGRVGGVFRFHGLLADFCAILFILQAYLFVRSRSLLGKAFYAALMAAGVFQIIVTANRGGFVIWVIGLLYMFWIGRAALTTRRVVIALPILFVVGYVAEIATARYGRVVTLFARLLTTHFESGIPDTRVQVWTSVLREIPEHIWIGHGPFYDMTRAGAGVLSRNWPHSAYLWYLWTTGIVGLAVFLWILFKVLWKSRPGKLQFGKVSFAHGAMAVAHIQIVQFALAQIRDEHQRGNVYPFLMWALIGFAVAARRIKEEREEAEAEGLEGAPAELRTPAAGGPRAGAVSAPSSAPSSTPVDAGPRPRSLYRI
ncbi:MAG: O-antigen ligase family protein [Candidatus Eisenbacteria bacterium]|nr:O-antigen ligase family protein [Candidatus Eisenbacteria bacterium]